MRKTRSILYTGQQIILVLSKYNPLGSFHIKSNVPQVKFGYKNIVEEDQIKQLKINLLPIDTHSNKHDHKDEINIKDLTIKQENHIPEIKEIMEEKKNEVKDQIFFNEKDKEIDLLEKTRNMFNGITKKPIIPYSIEEIRNFIMR